MSNVTFYENVYKKTGINVDLVDLLKAVGNGKWRDITLEARETLEEKGEDAYRKFKADRIPAFTISGTFDEQRRATALTEHSGFIAIDFDDVDNVDQVFEILKRDMYSRAVFRSVSGKGLCAVVRITPSKHLESFEGLERYYLAEYELGIDPACKDTSRLRFASYDPDLFYNANSQLFKDYIPKKKGKAPTIPNYFNDENDVEYIISQIEEKRLDLTAEYSEWVRIAFALYSEFGEGGLDYFHRVSQFHPNYSEKQTTAKYRSARGGGNVNIATFFYLANKAGLEIRTPESQTIARVARFGRKGDRSPRQVQEQLKEVDNIDFERSEKIVKDVYESDDAKDNDDDNIVSEITDFIRTQHNIVYNEVTMNYIESGQPLEDRDYNSIYLNMKQVNPKATKDLVMNIIQSDRTKSINPVLDFFKNNANRKPKGSIKALANAIDSPTGMEGDNFMPTYKEHFITKWAVGAVAMWHGRHSPLMLVLAGSAQNTGKTHFFRYLLPDQIQMYFGEFEMEGTKDDKIMMCNKILLLNDEMSYNKQADIETIKNMCSAQYFNVRKPYGKTAEDLKRLATLAGTSNNIEVLSDPTGNRRLIPIEVREIPHEKYNAVDKIDFWMEAYNLYKDGFDWNLSREDIDILEKHTSSFKEASAEQELILKYFSKPNEHNTNFISRLTNTEIKVIIEYKSGQKISPRKLGMELKALGFEQISLKDDGITKRVYEMVEK